MIIFRYWDYLFFEKGWNNSNIFLAAAIEFLAELYVVVVIIMAIRVFVIGA